MSEPERPDDDRGARLAESLRRAAEIAEGRDRDEIRAAPRTLPAESRGFAEGVNAHMHLRKRMTPEMGDMWELGHYDPDARLDDGTFVHLDGAPPRPIKFPAWFLAWFSRQNQRTLRLLDKIIAWLDAHGDEEASKRLADLDEVIEKHRAWKKLKARAVWTVKVGGPAVAAGWGVVVMAGDKIGRLIEELPVLHAVWKAIMGAK